MGQHRPVTFRVRQIPATVTRHHVSDYLRQCFDADTNAPIRLSVRSLGSSPDDWDVNPTQVATIEFDNTPKRFVNSKQTRWTIFSKADNNTLLFDKDFFGFTPLNTVSSGRHSHDCIAISGLASHAFGSWRWCDDDGTQFMWLRDQLPRDFPGMRIMTYGYDTDLFDSDSIQNIDDLARTFILQLKAIGRAELTAKPMIILAHSLGGIIVKRALLYLANGRDVLDHMLSMCNLVVAFGVPNTGMHIQHLRAIVKGQPNEALLYTLGANSPYLETIDESFYGIVQKRSLRIVSVFETKKSRTAITNTAGHWEKTGPSEVLVTRVSAVQKASRDPEDIVPINRDHSTIVKYVPGDSNYGIVRSYIVETIRSDKNFHTPIDIEPGTPVYDDTKPVEKEKRESVDLAMLNIPDSQAEAYHRLDEERKIRLQRFWGMLSKLRFAEQNKRLEAIEDAHSATFEWVCNKPEIGLLDWITEGDEIYWIRGKPGSGKSTLMKHLHRHQKIRSALSMRSSRRNKTVIDLWFFFNARGGLQEITFDGLLRTILLQIIESNKQLALLLLREYESPYWRLVSQRSGDWRTEDLKRLFQVILEQNKVNVELLLFLDALDEYEGLPQVIARWLLDLTRKSDDSQQAKKVRICFASREWDAFKTAFGDCKGFRLHEHTLGDIQQYTSARMDKIISPQRHKWQSQKVPTDALIQAITRKAEGVFLWVNLALNDLEQNAHLLDEQGIEAYVDKLPEQLEVFYISSLDRIPEGSRHRAFVLMEIVLRSPDSMTVSDLLLAAEISQASSYSDCRKLYRDFTTQAYDQDKSIDPSAKLVNQCSGLLECIERPDNRSNEEKIKDHWTKGDRFYVQFIHKTVQDFVGSPAFAARLLKSEDGVQRENGYTWLLKFRLAHSRCSYTELSFLAYQSERTLGQAAEKYLDSVTGDRLGGFVSFERSIGAAERVLFKSRFVFALLSDLNLYLDTITTEEIDTDVPLHAIATWCVTNGRKYGKDALWSHKPDFGKAFSALISKGYNTQTLWRSKPPWDLLFVEWTVNGISADRQELARILIKEGKQDPNTIIYFEQHGGLQCKFRALHIAAYDGSMVTMLLEHGAKPNVLDVQDHTPLDQWLQCASIFVWTADTLTSVLTAAASLLRYGGEINPSNRLRWGPFCDTLIRLAGQYDVKVPTVFSAHRHTPPVASRQIDPGMGWI